jgi:hypothetical protein
LRKYIDENEKLKRENKRPAAAPIVSKKMDAPVPEMEDLK